MKVLAYDTLAQNFPENWATIEAGGEEVIITRRHHRVARIVPEPLPSTALDIFGDLHGLLGEAAGSALAAKLEGRRNGKRRRGTLGELRNPWAS